MYIYAFRAVWPPANPISKQYRKGNCENRVDSPVCGCTGTRVCVRVRVCTTSLRVKADDCGVSGKINKKCLQYVDHCQSFQSGAADARYIT